MASKKELGQEIAGLKREQRRINMIREHQGAELARYRAEECRRIANSEREARRKREEKEHKERREHLDHLGAGRLPVKNAESWAFVHEPGKTPAIEVTVPLDAEELRVLQEHLHPKPPKSIEVYTPLHSQRPRSIWEDFLSGARSGAFRI
ncbi:hypothetical protein [Microbacterium hydrocarbonoxydans]|uniref:hypothetical protein n=1 Tax=Microbacterium hydrocarbonoxydans TaxID=273678 RepID=UPI003D960A9C